MSNYYEPDYVSANQGNAYESWCVEFNKDPDGDHWDEFEEDMEAMREDAEIAAAEDRADAMLDDWDY